MRLLAPALLLALLAPIAAAQAEPHLTVSVAGLPESLGTMESSQTRDAPFRIDVRLDGIACPADTKLPVQLAVDDHTQAPFLRVALEPAQLSLTVPAGAYPAPTAGNDASYHGVTNGTLKVATGFVTADTSFLVEVTASVASLPDGCKSTGDIAPARSAPMATRVETSAPKRIADPADASPLPAAPSTTSAPRNAPAPGLGLVAIAVLAVGSLMRRVRP